MSKTDHSSRMNHRSSNHDPPIGSHWVTWQSLSPFVEIIETLLSSHHHGVEWSSWMQLEWTCDPSSRWIQHLHCRWWTHAASLGIEYRSDRDDDWVAEGQGPFDGMIWISRYDWTWALEHADDAHRWSWSPAGLTIGNHTIDSHHSPTMECRWWSADHMQVPNTRTGSIAGDHWTNALDRFIDYDVARVFVSWSSESNALAVRSSQSPIHTVMLPVSTPSNVRCFVRVSSDHTTNHRRVQFQKRWQRAQAALQQQQSIKEMESPTTHHTHPDTLVRRVEWTTEFTEYATHDITTMATLSTHADTIWTILTSVTDGDTERQCWTLNSRWFVAIRISNCRIWLWRIDVNHMSRDYGFGRTTTLMNGWSYPLMPERYCIRRPRPSIRSCSFPSVPLSQIRLATLPAPPTPAGKRHPRFPFPSFPSSSSPSCSISLLRWFSGRLASTPARWLVSISAPYPSHCRISSDHARHRWTLWIRDASHSGSTQ